MRKPLIQPQSPASYRVRTNLTHQPKSLFGVIAVLVLALGLSGTGVVAASSMKWNCVAPPAGRSLASMAYDSRRDKVVMFGGKNTGYYGDTWEWDGKGWNAATVTGPPAVASASMAYDSVHGKTVLFGGYVSGTFYGDTWQWDGSTWTKAATSGPSPRNGACMAFDSVKGKAVLFGGTSSTSMSSILGDTWEWDGTSWTQVATAGPPRRSWACMAYDSARGKAVLFGGVGIGGNCGDTWEWDGSTWTQRATSGPSARYMASMVYDSIRHKVVLFGSGSGSDTWEWDGQAWIRDECSGPSARTATSMAFDEKRGQAVLFSGLLPDAAMTCPSDTWTWNGMAWTQVSGSAPPARQYASMVADPLTDRLILFGGYSSKYLGDTWERRSGVWTQTASSGPSNRYLASMAFDHARNKAVLFGGYDSTYLADTWEWDGSTWKQAATSGPAARYNAAIAYDQARGKTVLFGGYSNISGSIYYDDVWEWDGNVWTQIAGSGPSPRSGASMVYDNARHRLVLFGGAYYTGSSTAVYGDTWEWDGNAWTQVASTGPSPRLNASMVFDGIRGKTVLFGGRDAGAALGDTWEWDGASWTRQTEQGPTARAYHVAVFDSAQSKIVLFGGSYRDSSQSMWVCLDDTWEYGICSAVTLQDAVSALKIAAGITPATTTDIQTLILIPEAPAASVDIADAVRIARQAVGLDTGQ